MCCCATSRLQILHFYKRNGWCRKATPDKLSSCCSLHPVNWITDVVAIKGGGGCGSCQTTALTMVASSIIRFPNYGYLVTKEGGGEKEGCSGWQREQFSLSRNNRYNGNVKGTRAHPRIRPRPISKMCCSAGVGSRSKMFLSPQMLQRERYEQWM